MQGAAFLSFQRAVHDDLAHIHEVEGFHGAHERMRAGCPYLVKHGTAKIAKVLESGVEQRLRTHMIRSCRSVAGHDLLQGKIGFFPVRTGFPVHEG